MLLRIKKRKKRFLFCANSKKAISALIGYVLLVSFVIIMGTIVYQVLETYVPKDVVECPEGVSIFVKESSCLDKGGGTFKLNLTLKNNGRFDIDGYFIHATKEEGQGLATWNISGYFEGESSTKGGLITFKKEYPLEPSQEIENIFNLDYRIYSVEILPIRFQPGFVSCWEAKVSEKINCGAGEEGECTNGETQNCPFQEGVCLNSQKTCTNGEWPSCDYTGITGYELTEVTCSDGLDNDCDGDTDDVDTDCGGTCTDGDTQLCLLQEGVCLNSEKICTGGEWSECDYIGITGYELTEITCSDGLDNDCDGYSDYYDDNCDPCNGAWNLPEDSGLECDGTPLPENCFVGCTCEENYISDGSGGCELDLTDIHSCQSYCELLEYDGANSGCTLNCEGACPGECEEGGHQHCLVGNANSCCCVP